MAMRIAVHCGIDKFGREIAQVLESQGVTLGSCPDLHLIVDAPWGWALSTRVLATLQGAVIIADNPCPEYRLDLLDERPLALLSSVTIPDIVRVLSLPETRERAYPDIRSSLTCGERAILRLAATGLRNKRIAQKRGVSEGRIKNILCTIYSKLELNSQVQLPLYYYGSWHILYENGWEPPRVSGGDSELR